MATPAVGEEKTLVTAGMICAVLLPPLGLIFGIMLMTKPGRMNDGIVIAFVAVAVSLFVYLAVL